MTKDEIEAILEKTEIGRDLLPILQKFRSNVSVGTYQRIGSALLEACGKGLERHDLPVAARK